MKYTDYPNFRDYTETVRGQRTKAAMLNERANVHSMSANHPQVEEGVIPAIFPGHHIYVMLKVKNSTENSSVKIDRKRHLELLGELTVGVREIAHRFDGALLEAQGPVVHCFIPDSDGTQAQVNDVLAVIGLSTQLFRERHKDEVEKILIAQGFGNSLFVNSLSRHDDHSIVSLAPAANYTAKALWRGEKSLPNGTILICDDKGNALQKTIADFPVDSVKQASLVEARFEVFGEQISLSAVANKFPNSGSAASPTTEEPHESFSISIRADMDGFTSRVESAFRQGREAVFQLGEEFYEVMVRGKEFAIDYDLVQLPWAGDCFNVLWMFDSNQKSDYQKAREGESLELTAHFESFMKRVFPNVDWSFSVAGGDLENAQTSNTLVARLDLDGLKLLVSAGKPVVRSLRGLTSESPDAGRGILWKEDATALDDDYRKILDASPSGANYRHFAVSDVRQVAAKQVADNSPPVYISTVSKTAAVAIPQARPYLSQEDDRGFHI